MNEQKKYKDILLMKAPDCIHPASAPELKGFRQRHTFRPTPSLALASLSAFLERRNRFGYRIEAVDVNLEGYREPGTPIDIRDYPGLLEHQIKNRVYDVLAISVTFVINVRWLELAVSLSRQYHPQARIIVGGGYPTIFPERCLREHGVDTAVIGEGEATLVHILNRYNNFRDNQFEDQFPFDGYAERTAEGKIEVVPKKSFMAMADLPAPAWHYLDIEGYFKRSGERWLSIEGVRGCPYRCTYCCTQLTWGHKLRYKKVDSLIEEMKTLTRTFNARLHFVDDNRSVDRLWMAEFLRRVIEEKLTLEARPTSFSVNHLDREILDLLKKAGVKIVGIAVESGSAEMQKRIRKNLDFDRVREVVRLIHSVGLRVHVNYLVGFPGETLDQVKETLNLARELRTYSSQFLILVPYPGTEAYREARQNNLLRFDERNLELFEPRRADFLYSDEWTSAQLEEMNYDANIELNFLNNPALEQEAHLDDFLAFLENLLVRLPGHVIAQVVAGYIYKKRSEAAKCASFYRRAAERLKDREIAETFDRYLAWGHPIIKDFRDFCSREGLDIQPELRN